MSQAAVMSPRVRSLPDPRHLAVWCSVLFLVAVFLAGRGVLPFLTGTPEVTGIYRPPQPVVGLRPGDRVPVYDLRLSGNAMRSGIAVVTPDGRLRVSRYDGETALGADSEAVLLPASVRTLWGLAGQGERAELKAAANAFARAIGDAIDRTAASPVFEQEYLPILGSIVRTAAGTAWNAQPVQEAFADLMRVADPLLRQAMADDLRPVLLDRLEPALWEALRINAANILDVFSGFELDLKPLETAISSAIADRRVRNAVREMLAMLAGTPQMKVLAERMAAAFTRTLRDDPRVPETLARLIADGRVSAYLEPVGDPALALFRAIPRTLARLDEQAELNSLAADIFKTQARGLSGHVMIFMPTAARDHVAAADPLLPATLVQESLQ